MIFILKLRLNFEIIRTDVLAKELTEAPIIAACFKIEM